MDAAELNSNNAGETSLVTDVYFTFGRNQNRHRALNVKQIQAYFEAIGEISLIRLHPNQSHTYGFVHFCEPAHAAEVLSHTHHKIGGVDVRVKMAEKRRSAIDKQTTSGVAVPDLNDDCLREIFDYLNVLDLVSVAKVGPRFEAIAQAQFSIKHKTFDFQELSKAARAELQGGHLKRFLEHFGPLIVNLRVNYIEIRTIGHNFVLELISKYCASGLETLKLENFKLIGRFVTKMRPLLARIQKLYLCGCTFAIPFIRNLGNCTALKKLKIYDYSECIDCRLFKFNLPKLETISLKNFVGFSLNEMKKFLEKNPQLKKVSIVDCETIESCILPEIVRRIPLVEKISFRGFLSLSNGSPHFGKNAMHLKQLTSLKKLKIDCEYFPIYSVFNEMVSAKVPLEYLEIRHCIASPQLVDSISKMKTLKTLNLIQIDSVVATHLHVMCENLPELTKLVVDKCLDFRTDGLLKLVQKAKKMQEINLLRTVTEINNESFKALLKTVEKRTESHPLKITVPPSSDSPKRLSTELVNGNRDKLIVDTTNCLYYESDEDDVDYYDSDDLFDSDDYESDYEYDVHNEGDDWLFRFLALVRN